MLHQNNAWTQLLDAQINNFSSDWIFYGKEFLKKTSCNISNQFWKEAILSLYEFRTIVENNTELNFLFKPLWYNNDIKIDNSYIFYKSWNENNIRYIYDLFDVEGNTLSYDIFCERFNFYPPFTQFLGVKLSIEKLKRCEILNFEHFRINQPYIPDFIKILLKSKKGSREIYDILIKELYTKPKSEKKWESEFDEEIVDKRWKKINRLIFMSTKDSSLRWLHYRILHRIIATNSYLHKIGISDTNTCSFCNSSVETISHIFFQCNFSMMIWN